MIAKYSIAGLAGAALLASAAFAQSPSTSSDSSRMAPPAKSGTAAMSAAEASFKGNWRTSKLIGLNVYNARNESIGDINELLTDKNGKIVAVVLGVGGFLGVGEHLVAVPFDKMKFVSEAVSASTAPAKPATTTGSATTTASKTTTAVSSKSSVWYPDHAVYNATKEELKAVPEFKYAS